MSIFSDISRGILHGMVAAGKQVLAGLTSEQGKQIMLHAMLAVLQAELGGGAGSEKFSAAVAALLGVAEREAIPLIEEQAKDVVQEAFDKLLKH